MKMLRAQAAEGRQILGFLIKVFSYQRDGQSQAYLLTTSSPGGCSTLFIRLRNLFSAHANRN
jgi:hypothetical protein